MIPLLDTKTTQLNGEKMTTPYSEYKLDALVISDESTQRKIPSSKLKRAKAHQVFSRRSLTMPVMDQGYIGSCVGASGAVIASDSKYRGQKLSPLYIYHNAKQHDPWAGDSYSGTSIQGAYVGLKKHGVKEQ